MALGHLALPGLPQERLMRLAARRAFVATHVGALRPQVPSLPAAPHDRAGPHPLAIQRPR